MIIVNSVFAAYEITLVSVAITRVQSLVRDASEKVLGMITLEDIIEELVGEIHDEYDRILAHILASGSGWVGGGGITTPDLEELTGIDPTVDLPRSDVRNLNEWIATHLGHPVRVGDVIERNRRRVLLRKVRRQQVLEAPISDRPRKEDAERDCGPRLEMATITSSCGVE